MTQLLKDKEWFKPVPSSSMLRREPACVWFTAGATEIVQSSKDLPALHKDVLRQALKRWTEVYFFLPVGGITKQGKIITHNGNKHTLLHTLGYTHTHTHHAGDHVNIMEMFVTFVWGYYTQNQLPKVPALTDVGRLLFTYMWRQQHALFR